MKRTLLITLLITFVIATGIILTGCGTSKEAPQLEIEYYVENYLQMHALDGYISDSYEVTHNWDNETKTDTVQFKVTTEYEYGFIVAESECIFEYDKSSDLWQLKRDSEWIEHADYADKLDGAEFEGSLFESNGTYLMMISSIDFDTNEVVFLYQVNEDFAGVQITMETAIQEHTTFDMYTTDMLTTYTEDGSKKEIPAISITEKGNGYIFYVILSVRGIERTYCVPELS